MLIPDGRSVKEMQLRANKIRRRKVFLRTSEDSGHEGAGRRHILSQASYLKRTKMHEMKKKRDVLKRINYSHLLTVLILPLIAFTYLLYFSEQILPSNIKTIIFSCIYYNLTMLAFSAGYHKYFCHNTFRTKYLILQIYFAMLGSSVGLGSIRVWASLHRAHHQFTDETERDPYLIKRGFTWAHWGWLFQKPKSLRFYDSFIEQEFPKNQKQKLKLTQKDIDLREDFNSVDLDVEDGDFFDNTGLETHDIVLLQERFYLLSFVFTALLMPAVVSRYICNDTFLNGVLYPGIIRMFCCQQSLLSTESICHLKNVLSFPSQPFNDKNSSQNCNNPLISLLTYGQSHQNYHHEFPHDYRSTYSIFAFDPTKWFISALGLIGAVDEISKTPIELILQLKVQQQQHVLNRLKTQLNWGTPISKLPLISLAEFKKISASAAHTDRIYIIIQNIIHDITPFMYQHPGGIQLLRASNRKDATKAFYGGVYGHLTAAINLLATMRIGILHDGNEEEVWRRVAREEREVEEPGLGRQDGLYRTAEAA
ncbi:uncharacterized protein PRCAT00001615001 [Priceomyces carsonii]|uniref:uncharacterized protein n=1 Tax=Priceomyces carsonii TaxID=28549 RepID=UPI002ED87783|nr:unnamed protein product [Priceomyces carsonii]